MPISKAAFFRTSLLLLAIGVTALVIVVGMSVWLVDRTRDSMDEVVRLRAVRSTAIDTLSTFQDAETSQRGFLIVLEDDYLDPFQRAKQRLGERISQLRNSVAAAGLDQRQIDRLDGIGVAKITEMEETIDLTRSGQRAQALALVRSNRGKELMDEARSILEPLIADIDRRLSDGVAEQQANGERLWWTTLGGGFVILLITGLAAWMVVRYTRELVEARSELEVLNTGLEDRVKERTAELARANEEIQRFAYIVTHDLRAPLVNIMGFTSELEAGLAPVQSYIGKAEADPADPLYDEARSAAAEDLPEALGFIKSSIRKMDGLINAILRLSREGRRVLKPEPVDLKAVVDASAAAVSHQLVTAEGQISIAVGVPRIVTDRLSLEQIVGNLLDNAVKYRRPDTPLRIAVKAQRVGRDRITLTVEDNGRGIDPRDHERVFDLFRRSGAQDQPGEGIGLAHVRTLVRNLGGDISIASELGQGTTFTISLPLALRTLSGSLEQ